MSEVLHSIVWWSGAVTLGTCAIMGAAALLQRAVFFVTARLFTVHAVWRATDWGEFLEEVRLYGKRAPIRPRVKPVKKPPEVTRSSQA